MLKITQDYVNNSGISFKSFLNRVEKIVNGRLGYASNIIAVSVSYPDKDTAIICYTIDTDK